MNVRSQGWQEYIQNVMSDYSLESWHFGLTSPLLVALSHRVPAAGVSWPSWVLTLVNLSRYRPWTWLYLYLLNFICLAVIQTAAVLFLGNGYGSGSCWGISPPPHVSALCGTMTEPELTYKPSKLLFCHLQPKDRCATRRWNLLPEWREHLWLRSFWRQGRRNKRVAPDQNADQLKILRT